MAQRAKISGIGRFGAVRIYTGAGQDCRTLDELALTEARALLAETEPHSGQWTDAPAWQWRGYAVGPTKVPVAAALADALRSFVGEC